MSEPLGLRSTVCTLYDYHCIVFNDIWPGGRERGTERECHSANCNKYSLRNCNREDPLCDFSITLSIFHEHTRTMPHRATVNIRKETYEMRFAFLFDFHWLNSLSNCVNWWWRFVANWINCSVAQWDRIPFEYKRSTTWMWNGSWVWVSRNWNEQFTFVSRKYFAIILHDWSIAGRNECQWRQWTVGDIISFFYFKLSIE